MVSVVPFVLLIDFLSLFKLVYTGYAHKYIGIMLNIILEMDCTTAILCSKNSIYAILLNKRSW